MNRIQKKLLFDISERIDFIFQHHLVGIHTFEAYESSQTVQSAVERELIIIGEAVYKLFRNGIKLIYADKLINRRNTLAHQYDAYSPLTIWLSVHEELPDLKTEVENLLRD